MKMNLKLAVLTVFTILAILASGLVIAVMGQEPAPKKKLYQKTITMKITKDENGNIISSDTTFTFESPDYSGEEPLYFKFDEKEFEKSMEDFGKNFEKFHFYWNDSALHSIIVPPPRFFFDDSLGKDIVPWNPDWEKAMEKFNEQREQMEKQLEIHLKNQDSLLINQDIIILKSDTLCPHRFHHFKFDGDDDEEKHMKIYKYIEPDKDQKVIIIDRDGGNSAEESNVKVWKTEDGKAIIIKTKTSFAEISETTKSELEEAGIKPPKKDLEIEDLMIAPNPADGKFTLSFRVKEPKPITIRIYDKSGNVVYEEKIRDFYGYYSKEIDLTGKPEGTFFIQILQGIYSVFKKLMII